MHSDVKFWICLVIVAVLFMFAAGYFGLSHRAAWEICLVSAVIVIAVRRIVLMTGGSLRSRVIGGTDRFQ